MKKIGIGLLVFIGMVIGLWIAGQATKGFIYFTSPSAANEPTIKRGKMFFASNLVKPTRLDFICFFASTPQEGRFIRVHRLCGIEGDTVEMRGGVLFVNGSNVDIGLSLTNDYFIAKKDYESNKDLIAADEDIMNCFSADSCEVPISDKIVQEHKIPAIKSVYQKDSVDNYMKEVFHEVCNADNFGPIIIPAGKYFVLGDNRHKAEDSRFLGLIDKKDYVATVLWRK